MIGIIPNETWHCNSTDAKPTENVPDGQTIIEKDTGNVFIFDVVSKEWKPL